MKKNVSVPLILPSLRPCAKREISSLNDLFQVFLYLECFMRCRYSSNSPVSPSSTAPAISVSNANGYFRDAADCADIVTDAALLLNVVSRAS